MKNNKIVRFLVYNIWGMGGTVRTVANIANYLVERGYQVEIISIRRTSDKTVISLSEKIIIDSLCDVRKEMRDRKSVV